MEESNTTDPKAKAIEIVKKDWGEDDSFYFSYDGVNSCLLYTSIALLYQKNKQYEEAEKYFL